MRLSVILKDPNKKSVFLILKEAIIYMFVKHELPHYYFGKFLYRKSVTNFRDYLSMKETDAIALSKKFNKFEYASMLRNKLTFSLYCQENNLAIPKLLSYNLSNSFFYNGRLIKINTVNDLIVYFEDIFIESKQNTVFLKPTGDMGGSGCILLKRETLSNQVQQHYTELTNQNYIHQELIKQHSEISKINPSCINSIRFDTYIDKHNKSHILSALMRFGAGNNFVDNASSGGFYVKIDLNNGSLDLVGKQLMKYGGKQVTEHPDSKYVFGGFKIPYFDEACRLVLKAVDYIPDRIIGWDIAITETGPVLIEGNDNNSIFLSDIAYGGYLKHPLFKEILKEA
ncbi:sugar-transfer associated ATP-grasp domain-containing protein [Flavivirga sp. 57AJ16]|uniref:sugar-transfer associated ATP-grasp domain-containing protein n=1 Tax=Flavivirga sp. 57AJ16 TaxID=3025307 RepID=UPI00236646B8|nr:sugar-transfer associated ATP-grasp domain-containing protein [Flavivirga sp. 57AJ16]MDD7885837.1 sugar-transfer associated ATP-grasp domain-containing protein [Flavivirga sp. 57AJ16]